MPTYDYKCIDCETVIEVVHGMTVRKRVVCSCGGNMGKLMSGGVGLIFKGSGFYATDYKKKEKPKDTDKPSKKIGE